LAMLSNAAMLFGLLGTIYGLITVFGGVAAANPADKATLLSTGISHVMNCTGFGLIVAITCLLCFAILQGRTQAMMDDINETSVLPLNLAVANLSKMKMPSQPLETLPDSSFSDSPPVRRSAGPGATDRAEASWQALASPARAGRGRSTSTSSLSPSST